MLSARRWKCMDDDVSPKKLRDLVSQELMSNLLPKNKGEYDTARPLIRQPETICSSIQTCCVGWQMVKLDRTRRQNAKESKTSHGVNRSPETQFTLFSSAKSRV
ncbi:hypothetical protein L1887_35805 [Cichorium endivia]|nr:hypothetical protein L1887_35805 [Cichorium endivia]